jgi:phage repressor protein C with HTH and peptisase S24 domain
VTALENSPIYRDLMRFKPDGLSPNAWAIKAGVSRTVWSDMRRHGNPSRRTLEKLLAAAGSSLLEFEALRLGPEPSSTLAAGARADLGDVRRAWAPAPLAPLPLFRSSLGGVWDEAGGSVQLTEIDRREVLDWLPRPASLARDKEAYALTMVGDAMWPRFRTGSRIAVSPRVPVSVGDDVAARIRPVSGKDEGEVERILIMHLVKRSASGFELRQFNPDRTIAVDADHIEAIAKIAGELI